VFRRRKNSSSQSDEENALHSPDESGAEPEDTTPEPEAAGPVAPGRPQGPWDVDDVPADDVVRLDLGALRIPGLEGMEIQVNLDEGSGAVVAITVLSEGSSLQLQPFAAPLGEGIWDDVRRELASQITKDGGLADPEEDAVGTSLRARLPLPAADGTKSLSVVRFIGVDGPRWFLRGVVTGPAAVDAAAMEPLLAVFRGTVVVRGSDPHAPREPLLLRLPDDVPNPVDAAAQERAGLEFGGGPQITEIH
jgi:hypothetical protein